jgi:TIR domain
MPKVFVSYARADQEMVQALIRELQELGYDAFYDQNLTGGQRWWDVLLDQIQSADGFLPVLTSEYRQSEACHREAVWAESLGIPFVPIDLGQASPDLFEKVVAEANWVRYSLDDRASVARLARALGAMSKPEPPSPLPPRPAIPISYFAELEREIRTTPTIPLERQFAIIATLRAKLYTREDASARIMLSELRSRTDITYSNAVDIERMLAGPGPEQAAQQQQQRPQQVPPADTRHHQRPPEPPPTQHRAVYQQSGYQQGPQPQPTVYAPSSFQQAATQHAAANPPAPAYPQRSFQQAGQPPTQRRPRTTSPADISRWVILGVGALLVLLAFVAVDWISFKGTGSTAFNYSKINDVIGGAPGDVGFAIAYFTWLGYLLTAVVGALCILCVVVSRRPRVLVQTTVGLAIIQVIVTLIATVTEVNRVQDQTAARGVSTSYDVGLFIMIFGVILMTVAAMLPKSSSKPPPPRP